MELASEELLCACTAKYSTFLWHRRASLVAGASSKRVPVSSEHWAAFVEGCVTAGLGPTGLSFLWRPCESQSRLKAFLVNELWSSVFAFWVTHCSHEGGEIVVVLAGRASGGGGKKECVAIPMLYRMVWLYRLLDGTMISVGMRDLSQFGTVA